MGALMSKDGKHRFLLTRHIENPPRGRKCLFIMLNPSTADAEMDDPTIRRCMAFAKSEGCNLLAVVNLYAYRATDPQELLKKIKEDPIEAFGGSTQADQLRRQVANHREPQDLIICAWGAHKGIKGHADRVYKIIEDEGATPHCLGVTKAGFPRHPLYVRADKLLEVFRPPLTEERDTYQDVLESV